MSFFCGVVRVFERFFVINTHPNQNNTSPQHNSKLTPTPANNQNKNTNSATKAGGQIVNILYAVDSIVARAYNTDKTDGFSDSEKADVVKIWRAVADAYATWEVDVTTRDTTGEAGTYGAQVFIGGYNGDWLVGTANGKLACPNGLPNQHNVGRPGGVAAVGAFGYNMTTQKQRAGYQSAYVWLTDQPTFLTQPMRAAIHEVGHLLGLVHDGQDLNGAKTGTWNGGATGTWAPIMGFPYKKAMALWTSGDGAYPGAFSTGKAIDGSAISSQDDLATIDKFLALVAASTGAAARRRRRRQPLDF